MLVTFTIDNENFSQLDVSEELEVENFLALVAMESPNFNRNDGSSVVLFVNGRQWKVDNTVMKMKLNEIGVNNNDMIAIIRSRPGPTPARPATRDSGARVGSGAASNNIADLIRSIRVPTARSQQPRQPQQPPQASMQAYIDRISKSHSTEEFRKASRNLFIQMSSPIVQLRYKDEFPSAVEQYKKDPTNYEAFHEATVNDRKDFLRRLALASDPTSAEGQQLIADMIKRESHQEQLQKAMTEMPEAFIRSHMLYVKMKVNGVDTIGFVDSGAQITTISAAHAQKFNLGQKIDKNFAMSIRGVGGEQVSEGRIHSADIEMEGHHFPAPLNVLSRFGEDILIGLDTLRRHGACIDLAKNCLRLGSQGIEVPFLNERQYAAECAKLGIRANLPPEEKEPLPESEVENSKVAELVQLGFNADAAVKALAKAHNDIVYACDLLQSTERPSGDAGPSTEVKTKEEPMEEH